MIGLRAGELLGLTVADVDFERLASCPRKQADALARVARIEGEKIAQSGFHHAGDGSRSPRLFTKASEGKRAGAFVSESKRQTLQASERGEIGLYPVLRKLGIPTHRTGLHAFRQGLGTALANSGASPAVVQRTLRHTDIKTTLRFYVYADAEVQRAALANIQSLQYNV